MPAMTQPTSRRIKLNDTGPVVSIDVSGISASL